MLLLHNNSHLGGGRLFRLCAAFTQQRIGLDLLHFCRESLSMTLFCGSNVIWGGFYF
jgi:hypothetical protein